MAVASQPEMERLCVPQRKIRSNYYSDTFRGPVSLNGKSMPADIQKITVPFPEEKEKAFKERYHLSDPELVDFYIFFTKAVMRHITLSQAAGKEGSQITTGCLRYTRYLGAVAEDRAYGVTAYLVSEPREAIIGSDIITEEGVTLKNALLLGARLLQTVKMCNESDIHLGTFDMSSIYLAEMDDVKLIQSGYFFFGGQGKESPMAYPACAGPFLPDEVMRGLEPVSYKSDLYAACSLIWTLLSGHRYDEKPDLSTPPKYASEALTAALEGCIQNGPDGVDSLLSVLKDTISDLNNGNAENTFIDFSAKEEEADPEGTGNSDPEGWDNVLTRKSEGGAGEKMTKKDFYITIIVAIAAAALLIGLSAIITWTVAKTTIENAVNRIQVTERSELTEEELGNIADNVVKVLDERSSGARDETAEVGETSESQEGQVEEGQTETEDPEAAEAKEPAVEQQGASDAPQTEEQSGEVVAPSTENNPDPAEGSTEAEGSEQPNG